MKLHLPISVLRALCAAAVLLPVAQADVLTQDTIIEGQSSNLIGSDSYTYDGDNKSYDLTIKNSEGQVYKIASQKELSFREIDNFTITGSKLKVSQTIKSEDGCLIHAKGFTNASFQPTAFKINNNNFVSISDNTQTIEDNTNSNSGGAGIFYFNDNGVELNNNTTLYFTNNKVISEKNNTNSTRGLINFATSASSLDWISINMNENGTVLFQKNSLTHDAGAASGGAMCISGAEGLNNSTLKPWYYHITRVNWNENNNITFDNNTVSSGKDAYGGALTISKVLHTISGTKGKVSFSNNGVSSTGGNSYGGAINVDTTHTTLNIADNESVEFKGNTATVKGDSAKAEGGAIRSHGQHQTLKISGNDYVLFSGNGVIHETKDASIKGGAIYAGYSIEMINNKEMIFEKNYEKGANSLLLRGLYVEGGDLKLSAAKGGHVTFNDTIKVAKKKWSQWQINYELDTPYDGYINDYHPAGVYGGNLVLNEGQDQSGTIVFSGKYTQAHLSEIAGTEITDADVIAASRTSVVEGTVTLHAGTLSLQDDAVLQATEVIIAEGAALEAVRTDDVAAVVFSLGTEEAALLSPAATLAADLVLEEGAMVNLDGGNIDLGNNALKIGNKLIVTLSGDLLGAEELVLFTNVTELEGDVSEVVVNGVTTTGSFSNGDVIINIANVPNIPEPATAALSLLALAGLAARRRRK